MTDSLAKGALALDTFAYWQAALTTSGRAAEVLAPPFRASRVEADEALRRLRRQRAPFFNRLGASAPEAPPCIRP